MLEPYIKISADVLFSISYSSMAHEKYVTFYDPSEKQTR